MLNTIGMAKRAGRLEIGEEPVGAAARAHKARVLVLASDVAENSVRRAQGFAQAGNVPLVVLPATKAELGAILGRNACAMVAITEVGFAAALVKKLAAAQPGTLDDVVELLSTKAEKAMKRQKEMRQHEKKLQRANAKPWAKKPSPSGK